jgi:hypothetical protein
MRSRFSRPIAAVLAGALMLTSLNIVAAPSQTSTTDFSARRRHYNRGNAAALGAVIGVFGAIAAMAAADQYRDNYYYGDPGYGRYGYGAPYGYASAYRYRHGHGHHHR